MNVTLFQIDFSRSVFNVIGHRKAKRQLDNILRDGKYDLVHCHSPIGGMIARLSCKKYRSDGLKVVYTAHGFHFYKGAPLLNWLIFYPIEKVCSKMTDVLITINKEDYELAKKKMKSKRVEYLPGIGVDIDKFKNVTICKEEKRKELGIPENAYLILSVGELNKNKNHKVVINAISHIKQPTVHYAIVGKGPLKNSLLKYIKKKGVEDRVHLLGYRTDMPELYKCSDCFAHPSFREGLPVSVMEAMASELPCITSNIRGCRDLIVDPNNMFDPKKPNEVLHIILRIMKTENAELEYDNILSFSIPSISRATKSIYKSLVPDNQPVCL